MHRLFCVSNFCLPDSFNFIFHNHLHPQSTVSHNRDFATPHSHHTFNVFVIGVSQLLHCQLCHIWAKYFEFSSGFHLNVDTLIIVLPLCSFLAACVNNHYWTQQPVKESFHWNESTLFVRDPNHKRLSLKDSPSILHGINFISQTVITEVTE